MVVDLGKNVRVLLCLGHGGGGGGVEVKSTC